jgi:hypothetical protein
VNFDWLIGLACTGVSPSTEHSSAFRFGNATLVVESLWRISRDGRLRRTSNDNGQRFGHQTAVDANSEATELLAGRRIAEVRVEPLRGDVVIRFDGEVILEVITDSAGYEAWTLSAPGRSLVAASGGTVHNLSPEV